MKRLAKPAAAILRKEIEAGRVLYTLETHLMLFGSCRTFEPVPAVAPTMAQPGSDEKIEVMRYRVSVGQSLTHPADSRRPLKPANKIPRYIPGLVEIDLSQIHIEA